MRISDRSVDVCSSVLLDWQLVVRGHHMHDVNYIVTTALSIGDRRNHERDLLAYYLDRLKAHGDAASPDFEESWTEYKRCLVWGVYIGWLTNNLANYGWAICILTHLRFPTAFKIDTSWCGERGCQ